LRLWGSITEAVFFVIINANCDSGLPQGYTKSLERRVCNLENFIRTSTVLSPMPRKEFDVILQGMEEPEGSEDLDIYLSRLVTTTDSQGRNDRSQCDDTWLPSTIDVTLPGDENLVEPTGLVSVNKNSVISYVGVTSGIHLVTQCEKIDSEVWYQCCSLRSLTTGALILCCTLDNRTHRNGRRIEMSTTLFRSCHQFTLNGRYSISFSPTRIPILCFFLETLLKTFRHA